MTVLSAENVRVHFGERLVLDEVGLSVEAGEAVALIGANGAGKSTFLKVLAGVLTPEAGRVELLGDELSGLSRREVARRVAVVPQGRPQVFDFGLLEFVLMGYHARSPRFALPSKSQIDGAYEALEALSLKELADQPVSVLSGGELQRALMARAMVSATPLWFLDEPTASLDMHHQIALLEEMERHVKRGGAALAILHDLALVHRFFDRVLLLKGGRLLAEGPPRLVMTEEAVSEVFGVPLKRGDVEGRVVWVVG